METQSNSTQSFEISPKESTLIIKRLKKDIDADTSFTQKQLADMKEAGEEITPSMYSYRAVNEKKKDGIDFCKDKTIKELYDFLAQNSSDKIFRLGIEMYLDKAKDSIQKWKTTRAK